MKLITAHAELNEEQSRQFLYIKKRFGMKNNSEIIRRLVQEKYEELIESVPHDALREAIEKPEEDLDPSPDR